MERSLLQDIFQWDVDAWSVAMKFWESKLVFASQMKGLEIGGREGGLSLWLALNGVHTVCSDLCDVQLTASPLHVKYAIDGKVQYQDIDATNIPYENYFDIIVFKSVLGGVGRNNQSQNQAKAIAEMHKALKPGGKLLFVENLVASPLHQFLRKKFVKWGNSWRYVTMNEMNSYLGHFRYKELKSTGFLSALGRTEQQRNLLSVFDKYLFNSIVPSNYRYICYGIAEK